MYMQILVVSRCNSFAYISLIYPADAESAERRLQAAAAAREGEQRPVGAAGPETAGESRGAPAGGLLAPRN